MAALSALDRTMTSDDAAGSLVAVTHLGAVTGDGRDGGPIAGAGAPPGRPAADVEQRDAPRHRHSRVDQRPDAGPDAVASDDHVAPSAVEPSAKVARTRPSRSSASTGRRPWWPPAAPDRLVVQRGVRSARRTVWPTVPSASTPPVGSGPSGRPVPLVDRITGVATRHH